MKNIPPLDLARQYTLIEPEISAAVLEVLASGRYIGGAIVQDFEEQFAHYIGVDECVACNSGTDALYLALRALDIGCGDEVITTPFTFMATAEAISLVGATPVFVDIEADTFNLDVDQVAAAITGQTKAILPVHLFGQPVQMTKLLAIAQEHNLSVIEDCAQATGAEWDHQKVGSLGHIGCFSFFPTKNLGAFGDAGALVTNDPAIAAKVRMLKDHGQTRRYYHQAIGVNSRMDAVQAAILLVKLRYLDQWNHQRRAISTHYHQLLQAISALLLPQEPAGGLSVWNQYTIRLQATKQLSLETCPRDWLQQQLQTAGISSMVYYPLPLHLQPTYQNLGYSVGQLPVAEQISNQVLSLPMFPELSPLEQERVVYCLKDCLSQLELI